ncbi:hypothetical protein B0J14DRAFT_650448 [Halenospora varia]|nr:hypothetical protein B0J14DRAFT_650448 [Halenospora varia]
MSDYNFSPPYIAPRYMTSTSRNHDFAPICVNDDLFSPLSRAYLSLHPDQVPTHPQHQHQVSREIIDTVVETDPSFPPLPEPLAIQSSPARRVQATPLLPPPSQTPRTQVDIPPARPDIKSPPTEPAAYRIQSPFHPALPYVVDSQSLLLAVQEDPQRIFNAILSLVIARDELSAQLQSVMEDYEGAKRDFKIASDRYEDLYWIENAKLVLLWKFIDRLKGEVEELGGKAKEDLALGKLTIEMGEERSKAGSPESDCESFVTAATSDPSGSAVVASSATSVEWMRGLDPAAVSVLPFPSFLFCVYLREELLTYFVLEQQTFIPVSPAKSFEVSHAKTFPAKVANSTPLNAPTAPLSLPPAVLRAQTLPQDNNSGAVQPVASPIPDAILQLIISSLPDRFYGVCPFSLCSQAACPVPNCRMLKLCPGYNDETTLKVTCNKPCPLIHEYRTCEEELDSLLGYCYRAYSRKEIEKRYMETPRPKSPIKKGEAKYKEMHNKKRIHKTGCDRDEWKAREVIAGLRDLHAEGRNLTTTS